MRNKILTLAAITIAIIIFLIGAHSAVCAQQIECGPVVTATPRPTETPTPTPVPVPIPTPQPHVPEPFSPTSSEVCVGEPVTVAPGYDERNMHRIDEDTVNFSWFKMDKHAQGHIIYYSYDKDNLKWSTHADIGIDNVDIHGLPGSPVWVKVCSLGACGDQWCGVTVDP